MENSIGRKQITAMMLGNSLEWYDFIVYAMLVPVISPVFFPKSETYLSYLAAFGVFAIGYCARPIGGLIFGHMGDKYGRRSALLKSIICMSVPTVALGLLPTNETAGIAAPLLLILLRLCQGAAVGGEFPTTMCYLVENAPRKIRAYLSSHAILGVMIGIIMASLVMSLLSTTLTKQQMYDFGWRIPFLLSAIFVVACTWLRLHLSESKAFDELGDVKRDPFLQTVRKNLGAIIILIIFLEFNTVGFYSINIYTLTFLKLNAGFDLATASRIVLASSIALLIFIPLAGKMADRFGPKRIMGIGLILAILFTLPLYYLVDHHIWWLATLGQLGLVAILALFIGPMPVVISLMFSTKSRCTSLALGYNISLGVFGGTAPMVNLYLIKHTHEVLAPAFYVMIAAIISLCILPWVKEIQDTKLPQQ